MFALIDRARTDQNGAALPVFGERIFNHTLPFLIDRAVDLSWQLLADRRAIRGNRLHFYAVDLLQLAPARGSRSGHAAQTFIS